MSKKALSTVATRHQVFLERLKVQTSRDFVAVLPKLEKAIRDVVLELRVDKLSDLSRRALNKLLADLRGAQEGLITDAQDLLLGDLSDLAKYETGFEQRALQAAIDAGRQAYPDLPKLGPLPANAGLEYALAQPISATGTLLEPFIAGWGEKQMSAVDAAVTKAWGEGQTIQQLVTQMRGTRAAGFKDGLISASSRQAEAVARTAVQHVAQSARTAVWQENDDVVEGVIFVATLDSKTTEQCRALDGREFPIDEGPRPPLHINCRSTTIAKLPKELDFLDKGATRSSASGYVPADQTYYEWLGDQTAAFQDEALGPARGALFRDGDLSQEEFARLSVTSNMQPMTLADMARKEPAAFEAAGLDEYLPPKKG